MKAGLIAIVSIGILVGLPSLSYPFGRDQGIFALVARTILEGGLPYRDVFDFKPPGVFYMYAGIQALLSAEPWALRLVDLVWQIATALVLARLGRKLISPFGGTASGIIYLICYYSLGFWYGAQPDGFLVIWVLGFVLLLTGPDAADDGDGAAAPVALSRIMIRPFLGGVLLGVAAMFKYPAASVLLLALVRVGPASIRLGARERLLRFLSASLGLGVVPALWVMYAIATGMWNDFYAIEFEFTPKYIGVSHGGWIDSIYDFLIAIGRGFRLPWWCRAGLVAALLASIYSARVRRTCAPLLIGFGLGLIGIIAQGKYFTYQVIVLLPWYALLAATVLDLVLRTASDRVDSKRLTWVLIAGVVLASTPLVAKDWIRWLRSDFGRRTSWLASFTTSDFRASESDALATYFREQTRADEAVFIWGFEPQVYLLSDRRCPTRFIYNLPQRAPFAPDEWKRDLLIELAADRPALIAVERGDYFPHVLGNTLDSAEALESFGELRSWMMANYEPDRIFRRFQVLRRRE
ncbi:MAG: hypothetical protein O7B25_04290 [Gammaproteobacteria bacterium]|nr:hypothetical protein [Gammaproteobacteria bacterium]